MKNIGQQKDYKLTAFDLMVGNWVLSESIKERYAKITEIYLTLDENPKRMVSMKTGGIGNRYCVPIEEIEPIPLTKEILEKNGFVPLEEDSYVYKEGDDVSIVVDLLVPFLSHVEKDNIPKARYMGEMKFVHQLQNAFKLCGVEKEIIV